MMMLLARRASRTATAARAGAAGGMLRLGLATPPSRLVSSTSEPQMPLTWPPHLTGADPADFPPIKRPEASIREGGLKQPTKTMLKSRFGVEKVTIPLGIDYGDLTLPVEWLRDNCTCSKCVDPHSGQKTFASSEVSWRPEIEHLERTPDSGLRIVWANEGLAPPKSTGDKKFGPHESVYSFEYLASLSQPPPFERYRQWPQEWLGSSFTPKNIHYAEWMAGGDLFEEALLSLDKTGLVFVKGVPKDEKSVEEVASKIGNIYETFYGRTWDVRSKKNAENVAYTNDYLGLHQDLMYKSDPPRIQLLHCLENSCNGGESMYSDGRAAARRLTQREYRRLAKWPVRYGYDRNGHLYNYERAVFTGTLENGPSTTDVPHACGIPRHDVNGFHRWRLAWSPPFQTLQMHYGSHKYNRVAEFRFYIPYRRSAVQFQNAVESPSAVLEYKMEPGDCVLFDNWRILHGRRQFDTTSGDRWLKGTYIDHQVFDSKVRLTLRERERQGKWKMEPMPDYPALIEHRGKSKSGKVKVEDEDLETEQYDEFDEFDEVPDTKP